MRLVDRLSTRFLGRGLEPSGAAVLTTTYGMLGNEPILPGLQALTQKAYSGNAIVFGAVLARMMLFSEATFKYRDLRSKALFGTPDLVKLEEPWPGGTTGELLARMVQDVDLAGNAYVWDAGSQLVRLRPDWVTIISEEVPAPLGGWYRRVLGYWYEPPITEPGGGDGFGLPVEDVAHWSPIPDPQANFRGMSWMTPIIREVNADNAMTAYKEAYLTNAASPNLLIKYTQKLNDGQLKRIRDRVTFRYEGAVNAFKTLVLDEGADATVIGNTFEQMNFSTVQAAGENRIVIASGVPGIVIGSKEGLMAATYSNYEQAMRRFADITMRPLWRSACGSLTRITPRRDGARLWFDTSDISALRQGEKERAETLQVKAEAAGALVRAGYDPDTVAAAVEAGDIGLARHMGVPPVTVQETTYKQLLADAARPPAPAVLPAGLNGNTPALPAASGSETP